MLVAENPSLVSKLVIGQSYQGRPLNVLKVNQQSGHNLREVQYTDWNTSVIFTLVFI